MGLEPWLTRRPFHAVVCPSRDRGAGREGLRRVYVSCATLDVTADKHLSPPSCVSSGCLPPRASRAQVCQRRSLHCRECHSRFGRGRGNGMGRRSTAVLCTSVVSWVEAGLRKAAIGSVGGGLGTEAALGIEPVTSSLAGASLPPLVLFRIAKKPNTRIATTAIPCRVRRLGVSQGTTKRCCIIEPPVSPWRRAGWEFYSTVPNSLLEIGGRARDTYWDGRACLGVTHSSQASAEHFQQCAEFLPLRAGGIQHATR